MENWYFKELRTLTVLFITFFDFTELLINSTDEVQKVFFFLSSIDPFGPINSNFTNNNSRRSSNQSELAIFLNEYLKKKAKDGAGTGKRM